MTWIISDALHIHEGCVGHLTQETVKLLVAITGNGSWAAQSKSDAIQKAQELQDIESSDAYKNAKRRHQLWMARYN
jgi:hypothetical protein